MRAHRVRVMISVLGKSSAIVSEGVWSLLKTTRKSKERVEESVHRNYVHPGQHPDYLYSLSDASGARTSASLPKKEITFTCRSDAAPGRRADIIIKSTKNT